MNRPDGRHNMDLEVFSPSTTAIEGPLTFKSNPIDTVCITHCTDE
jgi:hypothetical protein